MAGSQRPGPGGATVAGPHSMIEEVKRMLKHSTVYGLGNILSKLVGFFLIPVYTRCLSPQDYGMIELLDLSLSFISMIVGMGLSSAVFRFYFDAEDQEERNCVVSTALIFISALAAVLVLVSVAFDTQISLLLFKTNGCALFFDLMIITFFFSGLIEIPLVLLRAQERSIVFSVVTLLRLVLALSLNIYFIVIARWGVTGFLVSNLTTSVVISLILVAATLSKSRIHFSLPHLKMMVIYGLPLVPSSLGMFWINFGDRFFLKHCYTDWEVGIYSLGYKFAIMISFLIGQPFFLIWSARMYKVIELKEGDRIYARFCTYLAVVLVFAGLGLSLVIPGVMRIVPSREYFEAHTVVPIVVLGYMLRELSDYFRGILYITKRTSFVGLTVVITAGVGTVLYLVLIPTYGMMGAALATLLTFGFMAGAMLFFAQRQKRIPYEFGRIISLFLVGAGIYFLFNPIQMDSAASEVVVKTSLSLLFFPLLYVFGFFTPDEKKKIVALVHKTAAMLGVKQS